MIWIHTRSIAAQVVKFHSKWDTAARLFVVERVCHHEVARTLPHARVPVSLSERKDPATGNRIETTATTAKTAATWVRRRLVVKMFGLKLCIVAVNKAAAAGKAAVGTIYGLAAATFAKLAKIDLGHLTSSSGLWSWLADVLASCQPFHYIVKEVRV